MANNRKRMILLASLSCGLLLVAAATWMTISRSNPRDVASSDHGPQTAHSPPAAEGASAAGSPLNKPAGSQGKRTWRTDIRPPAPIPVAADKPRARPPGPGPLVSPLTRPDASPLSGPLARPDLAR